MVSVTRRNLMGIIRGYQRALIQLKSDIEKSKDKLFFIKHISVESTQAKLCLIQVYADQSYTVSMREYGVYY